MILVLAAQAEAAPLTIALVAGPSVLIAHPEETVRLVGASPCTGEGTTDGSGTAVLRIPPGCN